MSYRQGDDRYEQENDFSGDGPAGDKKVNDYVSRTGESQIPVQRDEAPVEDPYEAGSGPGQSNSDEQLAQDEKEAIDRGNIIGSRTRGATKKAGTYSEPGDEEGLPGPEDGTSRTR